MVWFVDFELKYPRVLVPISFVFYTRWIGEVCNYDIKECNGEEWESSYFIIEKDGAKIVRLKGWPIRSYDFAAGAKHRFMFRSIEVVRGSVKLVKEGNMWVGRLPYGGIEYKTLLGIPGISAIYGYVVVEKESGNSYRVTDNKEYDAILYIIKNRVHSRTCDAGLDVKVVKGEGYIWCDSTSTTLDSVAACLVIAKPSTFLEIAEDTGPYRGECDTIVECRQILFDEEKKKIVSKRLREC